MANAVQLATIVIDAGSDWALTLGWEDEDGQPIPYTAIESEIRTVNDSLLARMTLDSGVVVDGETFRLEIDDETTKDFPAGKSIRIDWGGRVGVSPFSAGGGLVPFSIGQDQTDCMNRRIYS